MRNNNSEMQYRKMPYQIKYKNELNVVECSDATMITDKLILNHFAKNGYENLYITHLEELISVITLDDFLRGERVDGIKRDFICDISIVQSNEDIMRFFIDHPYIDRLSIVDGTKLVCEIDGLIELPLQNGVAKNIMALRYISLFKDELTDYFKQNNKILLIAEKEVIRFISDSFPAFQFDSNDDLEIEPAAIQKYNVIFDFIYSKNLRTVIGFTPDNLVSLSHLFTRFAIKRLTDHCKEKGVKIRFYRMQQYQNLTCLNEAEYYNCINRVKTGVLLQNESYLRKFVSNDSEKEYLKSREYHASLRLDNGYCFIQDECDEPYLHVHKGIRASSCQEKEDSIKIHFFGPCITYGFMVPDEETIPSLVYKYASKNGKQISVINQAGIHGYNELNAIMEALATPVRSGDVLIFFDVLDDLNFEEYPEAKQTYEWFNEEKNSSDIWFLDFPGHCNRRANELIAKHIYEDIEADLGYLNSNPALEERESYIGIDFDRYKYMNITHSSCISFFQKYRKYFYKKTESSIYGVVIIPDSYDYTTAMNLINIAAKNCDALYVLKFNDNLKDIEMGKLLSDSMNLKESKIDIRFMQPGYFFDSSRYLSSTGGKVDCLEEYIFIEKSLVDVLFHEMNVSVRFIPKEEKNILFLKNFEEIYKKENIKIEYV